MDSFPRSPRKLQKRSTSTSPYPLPRHSLENVSLAESSLSFGDTVTLSDQTEPQSHLSPSKPRTSSQSTRKLLSQPTSPKADIPSRRGSLLWVPELLVLALGLVCLVAITVTLHRANGNPPPQWPLNTNLNTIIAFLASLAKATFVMAIAEALGQLKWIWFLSPRQPRPLGDFQVFDEATKGGWGSWKLLFRGKGWLATFGAVILVSGLLTSTFTQMAVTYPVILAEETANGSEVATVQRAAGFSVYDGERLLPSPFEAVREQQAVYQGGFYPPDEEAPHVAPVCSSGDCTWPVYGSLAVCSDVVNLTAQGDKELLADLRNVTAKRLEILYASIKANGDIYGWANFQAQALPGFYPVILGPMFAPNVAFNESVKNLILNDNFVAYPVRMLDSSGPLDVDAFHFLGVTFWWCAKSYSTRVKAGEHTTAEVSTRSEVVPTHGPANSTTHTLNMAWSHEFYPCYTKGTCNETFGPAAVKLLPPLEVASPGEGDEEEEERYEVNVWTGLTVSGLLAATMWDSVLMDPSHGVVTSNGGGVAKAFALSVLGDFMAPTPDADSQLGSARNVAGNIARTITNLVRREAGKFTTGGNRVVQGTVFTPQARVRVHWGWICVLSVQMGCTAVFLGLTIWATGRKGVEVVKGSSLATLVALEPGVREELGGVEGFKRMTEKVKGVRVSLVRGEGGVVGLGRASGRDEEEGWRGKGGEKTVRVEEREQEEAKEVDTRRRGMVFEEYDTAYLSRLDSATGGGPLRRLMTDD
ncbi:hypothetical protein NKR19_g5843 [Coniochaeta hoffmannii]|uniref:Uncharacterized protein n=1 Tax=Coniochaeta hoffmannii TaxID=91930 RepID=A0AA38S3Z6_9PEZI|nr:hypothetical protein NKR19_g5843 [Coniochaeta hoffmannii]